MQKQKIIFHIPSQKNNNLFIKQTKPYFALSSYGDGNNHNNSLLFLDKKITNAKILKKINNDSVRVSDQISINIAKKIFNENYEEKQILYFDFVRFFIEMLLDKIIILDQISNNNKYKLFTKYSDYTLRVDNDYTKFANDIGHLNSEFQWFLFRLLAGSKSKIKIRYKNVFYYKNLYKQAINTFSFLKIIFSKKKNKPKIYYKHSLKRFNSIKGIDIIDSNFPNLILNFNLSIKNKSLRNSIAQIFEKTISKNFKYLKIKKKSLKIYSHIFSILLRNEIIEDAKINKKKYELFFNKRRVRYFLGTGPQSFSSIEQNFFAVECLERKIPIITFQHGGMIGYEKSMPQYCAPMIFSNIFISSGWTTFPSEYKKSLFKTEIVPLTNPYFSELKKLGKKKKINKKSNSLLVPLSKDLLLDDKLGNNIDAKKIIKLRNFIYKTLEGIKSDFNQIFIIYRSKKIKNKSFLRLKAENKEKIKFISNKEKKVFEYFNEADLVLWDVTSTGFIESLSYGLPTIAFNSKDRWSKDSRKYMNLLEKNKVLVNNSNEAIKKIKQINSNPLAWMKINKQIKPFLETYALADINWEKKWRNYLK